MVGVTATVDGAATDRFVRALNAMGASLGENAALAPKVMALAVCDSLRARTKKAPKRARPSEYKMELSPKPPRYITYKNHSKLPIALHRWRITRKLGTPAQYERDVFAYSHIKHSKSGKIVADLVAERRELRQLHLGIFHAGLAKASWGWTKKEIYTGVKKSSWKKRKRDRRNPADDVNGSYRRQTGTTVSSGRAEIHNHLDYISAATPESAVGESTNAASNKIIHNLEAALAKIADKIESGTATKADFDRATRMSQELRKLGAL